MNEELVSKFRLNATERLTPTDLSLIPFHDLSWLQKSKAIPLFYSHPYDVFLHEERVICYHREFGGFTLLGSDLDTGAKRWRMFDIDHWQMLDRTTGETLDSDDEDLF